MSTAGSRRELVVELAVELRRRVLPLLGLHAGRAHVQAGAGGDVTFEIDRIAEAFLESFLAERAPDVAFYSEDRGLVWGGGPPPLADRPQQVLIVDPIDGTRPAMAALESCCVSVAAAALPGPLAEAGAPRPTMGDVHTGCVVEIKSGTAFVAERGRGIEIRRDEDRSERPSLSRNTDISRLFWTFGLRGRPALPLIRVLEELIDASSVGGAVFDLGSATFDMTRIVTGQLDAYVDVGTRMIDDVPAVRPQFERLGAGAVLNNSPYDLAAAALCLSEAGAVVTDAYGEPLDPRPLLGSGHDFQMSCVAAASSELHGQILELVERGLDRLARAVA